ncbi:MAG TPA: hypothetical protein DF698_05150 [Candidatus Atribacteria bacterium]|nr:hypothetical protein [Candidatus Atribacteria bacterium]
MDSGKKDPTKIQQSLSRIDKSAFAHRMIDIYKGNIPVDDFNCSNSENKIEDLAFRRSIC